MRAPPDEDDDDERPPIRRLPKSRHGLPPPEDDDEPEVQPRRPEPEPTARRPALLPQLAAVLLQHIFTILVIVLVLGLFGLIWWSQWRLDLSPANFDRLQFGMTEAEVYRVLGTEANAPPDLVSQLQYPDFPRTASHPSWRAWQDKKTLVLVAFVDGQLHYKERKTLFRGNPGQP